LLLVRILLLSYTLPDFAGIVLTSLFEMLAQIIHIFEKIAIQPASLGYCTAGIYITWVKFNYYNTSNGLIDSTTFNAR